MKIVGQRLRELRESIHLSQMKFAHLFEISQSSVNRYENGDASPSFELLLKYAEYFDVSLDYIFGRTDDPHGMNCKNQPKVDYHNPEMARFVEMCFEPGSPMQKCLQATLVELLGEVEA